jgi:hypothetical protein
MKARKCHHCKEMVEDWSTHNCWIMTEAALTGDLSEDLQDAYERLRETAAGFGQQRIYASHIVHIKHRDEVEAPLTDWLAEAYEVSETLSAKPKANRLVKNGRRATATPRQPQAARRRGSK